MPKIIKKMSQSTIKSEFELFIADRESYVCKKTLKTYLSHYNALKRFFDENEEMTETVLQDLYKKVHNANDISDTTKASYLKTWRAFVIYVGGLPTPKIHVPDVPKEVYSNEDIKKLIEKPSKRDYLSIRNWAITLLLIETGCRASTLLNILPQDIDLQKQCLTTRHSKTNIVQVIPFGSMTKTALLQLSKFGKYDYLFVSEFGTQLTLNGLRSMVSRYNNERGVTLTSIHAYRHYFARSFLEKSQNVFLLQKMLGHTTLAMSQHYARVYDQSVIDNYVSPLDGLSRKKVV